MGGLSGKKQFFPLRRSLHRMWLVIMVEDVVFYVAELSAL